MHVSQRPPLLIKVGIQLSAPDDGYGMLAAVDANDGANDRPVESVLWKLFLVVLEPGRPSVRVGSVKDRGLDRVGLARSQVREVLLDMLVGPLVLAFFGNGRDMAGLLNVQRQNRGDVQQGPNEGGGVRKAPGPLQVGQIVDQEADANGLAQVFQVFHDQVRVRPGLDQAGSQDGAVSQARAGDMAVEWVDLEALFFCRVADQVAIKAGEPAGQGQDDDVRVAFSHVAVDEFLNLAKGRL